MGGGVLTQENLYDSKNFPENFQENLGKSRKI
jgi:hypothetical protein